MGATETTETEEVQVVEETEKIACNFDNEIACKIFEKGIEKGLTREQAVLVVAISAHETGWWKSDLFKNSNNFGGLCGSKGFYSYDTFEEGLEAMVNLLQNNYFEKGLDTIEKIGAKYCPVGAENDPKGLNQYWVSGVTSIYNNLITK